MRRLAPVLVAALALALLGCWAAPGPYQLPLLGDGECSWCLDEPAAPCWVAHDVSYGAGGTEQDRLTADLELAACMALHGMPEWWINLRYEAVREWGDRSWPYQEERSRGPAPGE